MVVSRVDPGSDEAARAFGVEILDALGAYLASVKPQAVEKVFNEAVAAVQAAIAKLSNGWPRKIDILERDPASTLYKVEYWYGKWTTMNIGLAGVGDGSLSEGAFRRGAALFLINLSNALAK